MGGHRQDKTDLWQQVESELGKLPGILGVRVSVEQDGSELQAIHVVASEGARSGKQLARDIETLCAVRHAIQIDHRKISIVYLEARPEFRQNWRLRIDRVSTRVDAGRLQVSVELKLGDRIYEGTAEGFNSASNRSFVAAQATLLAVQQYLSNSYSFALQDLRATKCGDWLGVVAVVEMMGPMGIESLVGCAPAGADAVEGALKAVLAAVNRRIGYLRTLLCEREAQPLE